MTRHLNRSWIFVSLAALAAGCGGYDAGSPGGFGATQGGVQDMSLARDLIAEGTVPPAEAFLVEGMFSEHELGLDGPACDTLLCLRGALGVAPSLDSEPSAWMQVGLSSTIDPETFERPSLTLIATVDVSGSMGWGYGEGDVTPGSLSRELLYALTSVLGPDDRIAIVTYGSDVDTLLSLTPGDDRGAILGAINQLDEGGVTDMESGLRRAYDLAGDVVGDGVTDETRVILFTDVQPNVGATSASEFEQIAAAGADDGVGLSVMALGLGIGQELVVAMSDLRGGNAFGLSTFDDVADHMDDHWPWFVSPIAYDMSLHVAATQGYSVVDAYGFPGELETDDAALEVATVFLSRRKGALMIRVAADIDEAGALDGVDINANLDYTTLDGERIERTLSGSYRGEQLDERGHYWEQHNAAKTSALAIAVDGMHDAAVLYGTSQSAAVELMLDVHARLAADAEALDDDALPVEVQLAADLLALMEAGAMQGTLYGY